MARKVRKIKRHKVNTFPKAVNLYKFIRLILGPDIASIHIAMRWNINEKNFFEFKVGRSPVPRLAKLSELAIILGINKHLVFQVADGTPARKVFNLIKKNDRAGQIKLLLGNRGRYPITCSEPASSADRHSRTKGSVPYMVHDG